MQDSVFTIFNVVRIFFMAAMAFFVTLFITPLWAKVLYKYKLGKQFKTETAFKSLHTEGGPIASKLHEGKKGTPTMGGVVIWATVIILALIFWLASKFNPNTALGSINFLSRGQTWVPFAALFVSALFGLVDDMLGVFGKGKWKGGLKMRDRLVMYAVVGFLGAWWFYDKLGWDFINIPFLGDWTVGWLYIPFFTLIIMASAFSANETDGLDGLVAGVFLTMFGAYAAIAFDQGRMDLVVLLSTIMGSLVAFLWYNIFPAKFFMGDTGSMSLGVILGVVAMLTNTPFLLIPIGIIFIFESGSVLIQLTSKKFRGKKIFLSTPIHHHFEALGWPETQVTMRFWMISAIGAIIGLIIFLVDSKIPPIF